MFVITTSWIGPFIIAIGILSRKYILKRFKKEGLIINIFYIIVLILLTVPFYKWQYKFTLTSLDTKSAIALVRKSLKFETLNKYTLDTLVWKPYDPKKKLYNIKASIMDQNNNMYYMYLQPKCEFFKGCKIGLDKMLIIEPDIKNIPLKSMNEAMFTHRDCSDKIARDILLEKDVKPFFKMLFKKWDSFKNSQATYRIDSLKLDDFKPTGIHVKNIKSKSSKLSNSCQANMNIKGDFSVIFNNHDLTKPILSSMFDSLTSKSGNLEIKTKIYYNIYSNHNNGSINLNALFVDMKKMRKAAKHILSKIKKNQNHIKNNTCKFKKDFPKDMVIYAGGAYGGHKSNVQIDQSGDQATRFDVIVNSPKKPVALLLSAYRPSIWSIKWTKGTKIEAIYVSGYYRQIVLGVPNSVPIKNSTYKNKNTCGYFYLSNKTLKKLNPLSQRIFAKSVKLAYIAKLDGKIYFGKSIGPNTKLYTSKDKVLSQYIDKSKPLAGQAGLRALARKGYLKAVTKADLNRWATFQEARYKKAHNKTDIPPTVNGSKKSFKPSFVLHGYRILKKITIPAGLYGANAATFFLEKGVPFPDGKLGHSTLYDFNTGKCYGVLCGHI